MARAIEHQSSKDTIVARATPNGDGAVAIVRLSGPVALTIADKIFLSAGKRKLSTYSKREMVFGSVQDLQNQDSVPIDQGLGVYWLNPASFTGEDVVEFHLHGSSVIVSQVIQLCVKQGARLAKPGEFSKRAFENGRIDLAQAEAICDVVSSRTEQAGRVALQQLRGGLSEKLGVIREQLIPVIAELEAYVDFPDEGIEISARSRLGEVVDQQLENLKRWLASTQRGAFLRHGARVVLAGPPNAGKSSLFNAMLRRERALVTPHAGTTRDTLEADVDLEGVPLTLVDTAGLRKTVEEIEAMGIDRAREEFRQSNLILFVVDSSNPNEAVEEYESVSTHEHFVLYNKSDINKLNEQTAFAGKGRRHAQNLSLKNEAGLAELEGKLIEFFGGKGTESEDLLITNARHRRAIEGAIEHLAIVAEGLSTDLSPEFILVDLTEAVSQIDSITGRASLDEDVLDQIFSQFCLGK